MARRPCVARCRDQLGANIADAAVDGETCPAAKIKCHLFEADLGGFRGISRVQFTFFDADTAGWQPLAIEPALAQSEIEPRTLGPPFLQIDASAKAAGNWRLQVPELLQLWDQGRDRRGLHALDGQLEVKHIAVREVAIAGVQFGH